MSAARRSTMGLVLAACAAVWVLSPAFAGLSASAPSVRGDRTARAAGQIYEVMVTNPSVGARTRLNINGETTVDEIITKSRREMDFEMTFLDGDWYLYDIKDETKPLSGKMSQYDLRPWGPEGMELHLLYQPKV
eukprot:CAMPEP_0203861170 /NCGR_PEP_ID=MMETSP0359-20131031/12851_1 /ASSEMBLY_ACC=CAM_ASM_000338 /TAXON_ID=268821 /ORGANISM="Scrippsiella Hangoei, Strain SHTV-5" /LENGTH=133 /DNA_ID=CAMNT_0050778357 /DNA_START=72 /DNA_END=473 /DNA_ORIENTATION=+